MSFTDSLASQIYSEADTFLAMAAAALPPLPGARLERRAEEDAADAECRMLVTA